MKNQILKLFMLMLTFFSIVQVVSPQIKVVYSSDHTGNYEIYVMELDENLQVLMTQKLTHWTSREDHPVWSLDGKKIAFRTYHTEESKLWVMDSNGDNKTLVTISDLVLYPLVWPEDSTVYGINARAGDGEVASFDLLTGGIQFLTQISGQNTQRFDINTDLSQITFVRGNEGNGWTNKLFIADFISDGTDFLNVTQLVPSAGAPHDPKFSPDGDRIAFVIYNYSPRYYGLGIVNSDGSSFWEPISNASFISYPQWIDNTRILFSYGGNGNFYVLNTNDLSISQITFSYFYNMHPNVFHVLNQPPIVVCQDVEIIADENCEAMITPNDIDGGSYDPDDDNVELSIDNIGPLSLGEHSISLTITDEHGESDACTATVTVVDSTDPIPDLPILPALEAECSLEITTTLTATDNCAGAIVGTTDDPLHYTEQGNYIMTWSYDDGNGNITTQTQEVIIQDITPPVVQIAVDPEVLWPPNHKMIHVTPILTVSDNCDPAPVIQLKSITMNEKDYTLTYDPEFDDGFKDGFTNNDIQVDENGNIYLRAERSGSSNIGRVYTITYEVKDYAGNVTIVSVNVTVPHNN